MKRSFLLSATILSVMAVLSWAAFASANASRGHKAASLRQANASQTSSEVFTIRYVCFVATPKKAEALPLSAALAREASPPPVLMDLQNGSRRSMNTTPESFLNQLRVSQGDHNFQLLLAGTVPCVNDSDVPAVIKDGPNPSDPLQATLNDHIFVSRNSPAMLTQHQTGKIVYTDAAQGAVGGPKWNDVHADNIVIGRTYSQGIINLLDGRRLVYAYCILPGRLDQTASAWSKAVKEIASHRAAEHRKTATR